MERWHSHLSVNSALTKVSTPVCSFWAARKHRTILHMGLSNGSERKSWETGSLVLLLQTPLRTLHLGLRKCLIKWTKEIISDASSSLLWSPVTLKHTAVKITFPFQKEEWHQVEQSQNCTVLLWWFLILGATYIQYAMFPLQFSSY